MLCVQMISQASMIQRPSDPDELMVPDLPWLRNVVRQICVVISDTTAAHSHSRNVNLCENKDLNPLIVLCNSRLLFYRRKTKREH